MRSPLWMSIEPVGSEVRVMLTAPREGTALKALLPCPPASERAVPALLEALSTWYALPLHAVLDADASDVRQHPERWALLVGDLRSFEVSVVWATRSEARQLARRRRFLDPMGSFGSGRRLITFNATGQR
jgi:hypothetical protein